MRKKFWFERLKGRDHSEDTCVDGRIIKNVSLGKRLVDVDWIHLAPNVDLRRAFVNTVMNLRFP
jgi:hypothetical protein